MKIIAKIRTPFPEKFGIPRQAGIIDEVRGQIVFEPEYREPEALRGIEGYSHLWIIWQFSEAVREDWSPTVRPPRLGGNKRMGVFSTRSPYRPNPIGLSCVRLIGKELTKDGWVLNVAGADMLNGTPIYDIKPYLAFTDSHPDASCGFADGVRDYSAPVTFPDIFLNEIPEEDREPLIALLSQDPRPAYKGESDREYGMRYKDFEVYFTAGNGGLIVTGVKRKK